MTVNRALLLRVLEERIEEMLRFLDAGCPEDYAETREEVERLTAQLHEEDDARRIMELLKSL